MADDETPGQGPIEWAAAGRPLPGQQESGDRCLVQPYSGGVLVAVVDGLGHGPDAAVAGRAAVATLAAHAGEPVGMLAERCHQALKGTRGVALSLALCDTPGHTLTWAGVGNIEGVLLRADPYARPAREYLLQRSGVVGYQMPPSIRAERLPVSRGDTLLLATDGIHGGFVEDIRLDDPPQRVADGILARCARETDDALVLVARYLGGS